MGRAIDDGHEVTAGMRRRLAAARFGEMSWDGGVVREPVSDGSGASKMPLVAGRTRVSNWGAVEYNADVSRPKSSLAKDGRNSRCVFGRKAWLGG